MRILKDFNISDHDWRATPQSVRTAAITLQHQLRLFQIRFTAYEMKIAALEEKTAEVERLKLEVSSLRGRLGQNYPTHRFLPHLMLSAAIVVSYSIKEAVRSKESSLGSTGMCASLSLDEVDHLVGLRPHHVKAYGSN